MNRRTFFGSIVGAVGMLIPWVRLRGNSEKIAETYVEIGQRLDEAIQRPGWLRIYAGPIPGNAAGLPPGELVAEMEMDMEMEYETEWQEDCESLQIKSMTFKVTRDGTRLT